MIFFEEWDASPATNRSISVLLRITAEVQEFLKRIFTTAGWGQL